MTPRLSGQLSIFGLIFFVLKPLLGIVRQQDGKAGAGEPITHHADSYKGRTIRKLMGAGGGRSTKKIFAQGKIK